MSISAVTGDTLKSAGVTDPSQLGKLVPGFTAQVSNYGSPVYSLRGIGFYDSSIGGAPAVSIYVDQVPLPYSSEARGATIDLERLEVLKGPQGTLFGQNSTGGAINYIAAKPTDHFAAGADVEYGRFDRANFEGFVSGPIAPTLKARIAVRMERGGDWQKSFGPVVNPFGIQGTQTLGARRFYSMRATLNWEPTDELKAQFTFSGWKDKSDTQAPQFQAFIPIAPLNIFNGETYTALQDLPPTPDDNRLAGWDAGADYAHDDYFYQPALRIDYSLSDSVQITSISAYSRYRERSGYEADGTAFSVFSNFKNASIESFSQELRASGDSGPLKWMIGASYAHDITSDPQLNVVRRSTNAQLGALSYPATRLLNRQNVKTAAGFGSLDYAISDQLTIQGSMRYTSQERGYRGCIADPGDGLAAATFGTRFGTSIPPGGCITMNSAFQRLPIVRSSLDQDNLSWRASVNWKPGADTLLYANVTKGYKAGSFSGIPAIFESQLTPVTQESVLAYEAGFKTAFADRMVDVSGAVFYYDYRDKQILGTANIPPFGNLPRLVNIPKSEILGAELQATVRPVTGLSLTGDATYLDTKILRDPPNALSALGQPASFVGDPLTNTPEWQLSLRGEYEFDLSSRHKAFLRASGSYRSKAEGALGNLPQFAIDAYTLIDLSAGIATQDGEWQFELWGRNITDQFHVTGVWRLTDTLVRTTGMPVTYGATIRYRL